MKYKRLTQQDIIQENDEYRTNWDSWARIEVEFVGAKKGTVFGWYLKMRRPQQSVRKVGRPKGSKNKNRCNCHEWAQVGSCCCPIHGHYNYYRKLNQ